jgi:hypothetical protein
MSRPTTAPPSVDRRADSHNTMHRNDSYPTHAYDNSASRDSQNHYPIGSFRPPGKPFVYDSSVPSEVHTLTITRITACMIPLSNGAEPPPAPPKPPSKANGDVKTSLNNTLTVRNRAWGVPIPTDQKQWGHNRAALRAEVALKEGGGRKVCLHRNCSYFMIIDSPVRLA